MKLSARYLISAVGAATAIVVFAAAVRAETGTLELKLLDKQGQSRAYTAPGLDYLYRATYPQHFFAQMQRQGTDRKLQQMPSDPAQADAFKRIVKAEPEYRSEFPFRGVAKLGTQEYAFALDGMGPTPKTKADTPDEKKAKEKSKAKTSKEKSAVAKLGDKLAKATKDEAGELLPTVTYDRLYFDLNHNGDLTDDKPIEAEKNAQSFGASYRQVSFPRIDVTIDVDGTKIDSAFFVQGYINVSRDFGHVSISLNAAAYREGEIELDGKKRHVVLIDFNSNGRFDDESKVLDQKVYRSPGQPAEVYPQQGDMLLVDLDPIKPGMDSPYDVTMGTNRHYVAKLVNLDGKYYDLKVSPAGDEIELTASSVSLGNVTNPNDGFRAVIYGDRGFLRIAGDKDTPIPVPVGEWKLLSYTIQRTAAEKPKPPAKQEEKGEKSSETSVVKTLAKTLEALLGGGGDETGGLRISRPRISVVSARATADYKAIKVLEGKTVELPFGPPYTPVVTVPPYMAPNQGEVPMEMSLVGSAGEQCSNIMVNNGRPTKPSFTITDQKGEVVQQGSFEYG